MNGNRRLYVARCMKDAGRAPFFKLGSTYAIINEYEKQD